jgi:hypothetical protein
VSSEPFKLPMIDDHQPISSITENEEPVIYENPAEANWVTGQLKTNIGPVNQVTATLDSKDLLGSVKTRCNLGRMNYRILPALYAIGKPDSNSPVLVSANYKLSFDSLRKELKNQNLWVLVIDTKGINVWCAAGKGSFGTAEVIRMVESSSLAELVSHRTLILPQLSAPGVAAHEVRRQCGFKVIYGPVRAADIPAFLAAGNKAEATMRRTEFKLRDRLVLAPVEIAGMFKPLLILAAALFLLNLATLLLAGHPFLFMLLLAKTLADLLPFFVAALVGIVLVPALLPYIPGRALAWKGWVLGIIWASFYIMLIAPAAGWLQISVYLLGIPAITAFLGMNFTGSTTYTSLSGVIKEMGIALPLIIASAALGLIGLIAAYFV